MKIYVKATSKKSLNERIASGETIYGTNFSMFGDGGTYKVDETLPEGTIVAIYDETVNGSPYAKSYGTWHIAKRVVAVMVFLILSTAGFSQTIERDEQGNFFAKGSSKEPPKETTYTFTDSRGDKHKVYMTSAGRYFVLKVSKKTGKEYRYYLDKKPSSTAKK